MVRRVGADTGAVYLLGPATASAAIRGYRVPPEMCHLKGSPLPSGSRDSTSRSGAIEAPRSDDVANDPRFAYPVPELPASERVGAAGARQRSRPARSISLWKQPGAFRA